MSEGEQMRLLVLFQLQIFNPLAHMRNYLLILIVILLTLPSLSSANDCYFDAEPMKKDAEGGNVDSQNMLAFLYDSGSGCKKNKAKAFYWHKKAAEQGDAAAQLVVAARYYLGENGAELNKASAFKWFKNAAEQGNANAQSMLGFMYYKGEGLTKDLNEAFKWFKNAAEQGAPEAQLELGVLLVNGHGGVPLDKIGAYNWFLKAAKQGNEIAQNNLDILCRESPWACK